ncbi:hypothetical protein O181_079957 [Austropuccinia psidii MF-1]|uniref:Reverse transcriptase Ty1/copia-type domain-containing protein n=1 Tax=Austropuccinia psidii MF-1 TaxID=1389203 RepID=A0A9Q3FN17_9BASI|nr:hypothetical protein [Austropuccinia psidii MF-1]
MTAPKDIESDILQGNIIERQSHNNQALVANARCVARGFKQKRGIEYQETFLPTGRLSTLRFLISHSAQTEQQIRQADGVTAYLNSELSEEESVFSSPPEGFCEWIRESEPETYEEKRTKDFMNNPTEYVLKLKESLYGSKQAARRWYQTLKNWLINFSFLPSNADPCLSIRGHTILFAWMDKILIVGNDANQDMNGL